MKFKIQYHCVLEEKMTVYFKILIVTYNVFVYINLSYNHRMLFSVKQHNWMMILTILLTVKKFEGKMKTICDGAGPNYGRGR